MRVIVPGSRDMAERYDTFMKTTSMFTNNQTPELLKKDEQERRLLMNEMDNIIVKSISKKITFVHGACKTGADKICSDYCRLLIDKFDGYDIEIVEDRYPADWKKWGRRAEPIRNGEMIRSGADYVIACWNGIYEGSGTFDCFHQATVAKIPVKILPIEYWNVR